MGEKFRWGLLFLLSVSLCIGCADAGNSGSDSGSTEYDFETYSIEDQTFRMAQVPGGYEFPSTENDAGTSIVGQAYQISETEVTYELWYKVRDWAENRITNAYTFENEGCEGHDGTEGAAPVDGGEEPVTHVSWQDAVVWCNALTEWYNEENSTAYGPVYKDGGIIRDATSTTVNWGTLSTSNVDKGFRLPFSNEWELAGRYRGNDTTNTVQEVINGIDFSDPDDGIYWTKGDSASGATAAHDNASATGAVAWYGDISGLTYPVKGKQANALGLCDMSGNVLEWCFDGDNSTRVTRGGNWFHGSSYVRIGLEGSTDPDFATELIGFRCARFE